jgi:uncharacterized protein YegP (UPF0339 family)
VAAGKVTVSKGRDGRFYWHRRSGGRIVSDSGQGYKSKWWARRQARREAAAHGLELVDLTKEEI